MARFSLDSLISADAKASGLPYRSVAKRSAAHSCLRESQAEIGVRGNVAMEPTKPRITNRAAKDA